MTEREDSRVLVILLVLYAVARLLQLFPTQIPALLIVIFHVVPPAAFALVHGRRSYGTRGVAVFAALSLLTACFFESLSLRTGFPFGHYFFTGVMGPKVMDLPILLAFAWVGVGYASWVVARLIVGAPANSAAGLLVTPFVAAAAMCAWDLSMDPEWAYIDRAWVWLHGGAYFGVPFSNYFGWLLTSWVFYQGFALWLRQSAAAMQPSQPASWNRLTVLLYATVAAGNLLPAVPSAIPAAWPKTIVDAGGRQWQTSDVTGICLVVSIFVMAPLALMAWARATPPSSRRARPEPWTAPAPNHAGIG